MKINLLFRVRAGYVPFALLQMLLLFWVATGSAQNVSVTGTVSDAQGVLPGVNVKLKNKSVGTTTDAQGVFQIEALADDTLVFSFIGYGSQEIRVGAQTKFTILLQPDETALEEVLVNAGYYKVKDKERTGSIAKITAKDIETQPVSNVLASMQGRMAGVNITQTTGVPGGGFDIQIRGRNSLRADGNAPLYIVDGVPYGSESIGFSYTSTQLPVATSPLSSLNPGDIESIEILKDADATAIYGSRGSNGVVLVTTKKGKVGQTRFTSNISKGVGQVTRFMDLMNTEQYLSMRAEAFANDGVTDYPEDAYDINGTWDQNRYTDWQKKFIGGTAALTNVQTSVSGGSSQTQFLVSGNFAKETTVFPGDFAYNKGNVHVNVNHTSEDHKFSINFTGGYTIQDNDQPSTDLTPYAWTLPPNAPALYDNEGKLNWEDNTFSNPMALLQAKTTALTNDLVANGMLSYVLLPKLVFRTSLGMTALHHNETNASPNTIYNPAFGYDTNYSAVYITETERKSWIVEPQLNWSTAFKDLKVEALIGSTFQHQQNKQLVLGGSGFTSNSLIYNIASASSISVYNDQSELYKYQAFYGRVNFNWDQKYILNFTGRRDGSSRFGSNKKFAQFGAVGAAWIFSNETFFTKAKNFVSFGKVRASFGTSGSDQIGNYQFMDTYASSGSNYDGIIGLQPSRLYNPNFGWESNKKLELALEMGFLKDRIFITAGLYRNRSSNQLVGIPLPSTTGFSSIQANLEATVENTGLEWTVHTVNWKKTDFTWTTDFNISFATNKLLAFPGLETSTYRNQFEIGQPITIRKAYHYTGLDAATGVYTFEDVNGDGTIDFSGDKKTNVDLNPSYFGGIQNHLKYKGLELDFLFQFVKQKNLNSNAMLGLPGSMSNTTADVVGHWQSPGDTGPYQYYTTGLDAVAYNTFIKYANSDAAITDASYIRLKNVSLTYALPSDWLNKVQCRLSLQAQNLLTLTSYKGADPEFRSAGYLPPLKLFTAGIQFTF